MNVCVHVNKNSKKKQKKKGEDLRLNEKRQYAAKKQKKL